MDTFRLDCSDYESVLRFTVWFMLVSETCIEFKENLPAAKSIQHEETKLLSLERIVGDCC